MEETFYAFSYFKSMEANDPWAQPINTPGE